MRVLPDARAARAAFFFFQRKNPATAASTTTTATIAPPIAPPCPLDDDDDDASETAVDLAPAEVEDEECFEVPLLAAAAADDDSSAVVRKGQKSCARTTDVVDARDEEVALARRFQVGGRDGEKGQGGKKVTHSLLNASWDECWPCERSS